MSVVPRLRNPVEFPPIADWKQLDARSVGGSERWSCFLTGGGRHSFSLRDALQQQEDCGSLKQGLWVVFIWH